MVLRSRGAALVGEAEVRFPEAIWKRPRFWLSGSVSIWRRDCRTLGLPFVPFCMLGSRKSSFPRYAPLFISVTKHPIMGVAYLFARLRSCIPDFVFRVPHRTLGLESVASTGLWKLNGVWGVCTECLALDADSCSK